MIGNPRPHFSTQEKVKIPCLCLVEGRPVADQSDQHDPDPDQFRQLQGALFENGPLAGLRQWRGSERAGERSGGPFAAQGGGAPRLMEDRIRLAKELEAV